MALVTKLITRALHAKKTFTFEIWEQKFFISNGYLNIPKNCKPCRKKRKQLANRDAKTPSVRTKRLYTSIRRQRLAPAIIEFVQSNVLLSVEGKQFSVPANPMTSPLLTQNEIPRAYGQMRMSWKIVIYKKVPGFPGALACEGLNPSQV